MNFIIANPNEEVLKATLKCFNNVFGASKFGYSKISHIEVMTHKNEAYFYTINPNSHEQATALDIRTEDQFLQVLSFITLGMEFTDLKLFLENQNAI